MQRLLTLCFRLLLYGVAAAQTDGTLVERWRMPTAGYRMKTWWFFGHDRLQGNPKHATLWDNRTGQRHPLRANCYCTFTLKLQPVASVFVTTGR